VDTLFIVEDDPEHIHAFYPNGTGPGVPPINVGGQVSFIHTGAAVASLAITEAILSKIIAFADAVTAKQVANNNHQPPINPLDAAVFQVILEYHQTDLHFALALLDALRALPSDQRWLKIPDTYKLSFQVKRVWLLSCESGGNNAKNAGQAPKFRDLAARMISLACSGFKTEIKYPSSNPPQFFVPKVYAFDTGNIVTGSTTLDPTKMSFKETPFWHVDPSGDLVGDDRPIDPNKPNGPTFGDYAITAPGSIYEYSDGQITNTFTYPAIDPATGASPTIDLVNFNHP
jgi:hypothetical protein